MTRKLEMLITEDKITSKVKELGKTISQDYYGKNLIVLGILKGSVVFFSDLIRAITIDVKIDFLGLSSYREGTVGGKIKLISDTHLDYRGHSVLVVEDIIDTGKTFEWINNYLKPKEPDSIKFCTFLEKPSRKMVNFKVDYVGYEIDDCFVVGYGLDHNERYRNLPYLAYLV